MALTALLLALGAASGNLVGALAVVRAERRSLAAIQMSLAFGAGFMLALVLVGVLPEVFAVPERAAAGMVVLLGYVLVHIAQHVITPHFHFGEETHAVPPSAGYSAVVGLTLHAFFDGVAIASGLLVSLPLGVLFFLAILLHKLPEGVTVASVMLASGQGRRPALLAGLVLGLATIAGALLTEAVAALARYGLALAAGVTLYVAASNLVPEVQASRGFRITAAFLGGAAALLLLRVSTGG
ncbi:MAG TPA: ZIP family metal transporter [Gemmatimonadales bacterium]|jgi:ZIP family zinc transporter/zinc and cadmium transporter|nr:ZIP family metal transporter [Gemmatimonadales bacterium]